jgi:hypothetical protein
LNAQLDKLSKNAAAALRAKMLNHHFRLINGSWDYKPDQQPDQAQLNYAPSGRKLNLVKGGVKSNH